MSARLSAILPLSLSIVFTLLLWMGSCPLLAQSATPNVYRVTGIPGTYTGTLIRGNSAQVLEATIRPRGDSLYMAFYIPDWAWYDSSRGMLEPDGDAYRLTTPYGRALLSYDSAFGEWSGVIPDHTPVTHVHFKKRYRLPERKLTESPFQLTVDGQVRQGVIVQPHDGRKLPGAVLVHGRGCSPYRWQVDQARAYARHGLAVAVYNKHGSQEADPPCGETRIEDHARDLEAALKMLRGLASVDASRVGLISTSAGGWLSPFAAARMETPPAFLVAIVGPATDIRQQQIDGGLAWATQSGLSDTAIARLTRYTEWMFRIDRSKKAFDAMRALLENAESEGWDQWLEASDIPASAEALNQLWVNRWNNYDPAEAIGTFEGPWLGILGQADPVVPWQTQLEAYRRIAAQSGKTNIDVVLIPSAGHGLEHGSQQRELPYSQARGGRPAYYKFDRVAYGAVSAIPEFMRRWGILEP